jgi:hypothetical protein
MTGTGGSSFGLIFLLGGAVLTLGLALFAYGRRNAADQQF